MVSTNVEIPAWWPDGVRTWFDEQLKSTGLEKRKRERLVRLATSSRMEPVADRLRRVHRIRVSERDQLIVAFLQRAWEGPDIWQAKKGQQADFRDKELSALAHACDNLVRMLKKDEELVAQLFAMVDKESDSEPVFIDEDLTFNPSYIARGKDKLSTLIQAIKYIGGAAEHGIDIWPPPEYFLLPRKRRSKDAETVFCIHLLLRQAKRSFDNLFVKEVATTVGVLLNLREAVNFERVKSVARYMRVDYDKPR